MAIVRRFVFIPIFDFSAPIMPCILAVMLATWIGGWKAGFFATVLNAALINLVKEVEPQSISMPQLLRLIMFVIIGGLISWGIEVSACFSSTS